MIVFLSAITYNGLKNLGSCGSCSRDGDVLRHADVVHLGSLASTDDDDLFFKSRKWGGEAWQAIGQGV